MTVPQEIRDGLAELATLPNAFELAPLAGHLERLGDKLPGVDEQLRVLLTGTPDGPARRRVARTWRDMRRQHRRAVRELDRFHRHATEVAAAAFALLTEIEENDHE